MQQTNILVHADPWGDRCLITGEPVTQNVVAEYLDQLNSQKRLKQIVVWVMPEVEQFEEEEDDDNPPLGVDETIVVTVVMPIITHTTNITNSHYGKRTWHGKTTKR